MRTSHTKFNFTVDDWEARRPFISASEAHKTLPNSKYHHSFWNEKVGDDPPADISHLPQIKRGKRIEQHMPNWILEDYGMDVKANTQTYLSKKFPWAIATPDGFFKNKAGKFGIEEKAPSIFNSNYGEPDTDDIPQYNLVQVHHTMAVMPELVGYYLFTYTENGITRYIINKDKTIETALMEKELRFMSFVKEKVPPPPGNEEDLIYHYFNSTEKTYLENPSAELLEDCNKLKQRRKQKKDEKDNEEELNFRVKRGIGVHSGIKFPDGKILRMDRCFARPKVDETKLIADDPEEYKKHCTKFDPESFDKSNPNSEYVVRSPYTKLHFPKDKAV